MTNTVVACTNINLLKESQIPASPSNTELYAVELDGKPMDVDASNATATGKSTIVGWGMPDYSAKVSLSLSSFPYTAPANGIVRINEQTNNGIPVVKVNGVDVWSMNSASAVYKSCELYVSKNDVISITNTTAIGLTSGFFPLKGV